jgi:adenylate kinase family enzyme
MNSSSIILIGPLRTGKSTQGKLLSARSGWPQASLDLLRKDYYREAGYEDDLALEIRQKGGFLALVYYWKQFELHAIERVLEEHPQSVIDFGAGATILENKFQFARLRELLAPYPNVVLILPSPDPDESIRILTERSQDLTGTFQQGFNWHEYFIRHPANRILAKQEVYTIGKTPDETCTEILEQIQMDE